MSFGLAATAVDLPWSPRRSWAYSRGNGWTIIGSLFVVLFAGAVVTTVAVVVPLGLLRSLGAGQRRRRGHLDGRDPGLLRRRRAVATAQAVSSAASARLARRRAALAASA